MEDKLKEKKAMIEVLENMISGMSWSVEGKKNEIERYQKDIQSDIDNGLEVAADDWRYTAIENAKSFLAAYDVVMKQLEKLI